jgi:hypothetical protein
LKNNLSDLGSSWNSFCVPLWYFPPYHPKSNLEWPADGSWNLNLTNLTHNHECPSSLSWIAYAWQDSNL